MLPRMAKNQELVEYLEGLLEAVRAETLVTFVGSATVLPEGSDELDGRAFAATGRKIESLSDEDVQYTLNATTVGMANAFEQIGITAGDLLRARARARLEEEAAAAKPRIIL
jgi:hypothetical protein